MTLWLACMIIGACIVAYAVTHCPLHSSVTMSRMEAVVSAGFLLLLLGAVMICWRWMTIVAMLPN